MRCKACNRPVEIYINSDTGTWEDLCTECKGVSYRAADGEFTELDGLSLYGISGESKEEQDLMDLLGISTRWNRNGD